MKIVIIDGIHNELGATRMLVNNFIDGLKSKKINIDLIQYSLVNENFNPCKGCGICTKDQNSNRGVCNLNDKATEIINSALEADILVFATPIYEYSVSSTMKKFLERCLPLGKFGFGIVSRIKAIKGKKGVIICVSGAPNPINHIMGITWYCGFILKIMCKFFGCSEIKTLYAGGITGNEIVKNKFLKKAYNLGYKII